MGGVTGGINALIGHACRSFTVVKIEYEWFQCSTGATPWDRGLMVNIEDEILKF